MLVQILLPSEVVIRFPHFILLTFIGGRLLLIFIIFVASENSIFIFLRRIFIIFLVIILFLATRYEVICVVVKFIVIERISGQIIRLLPLFLGPTIILWVPRIRFHKTYGGVVLVLCHGFFIGLLCLISTMVTRDSIHGNIPTITKLMMWMERVVGGLARWVIARLWPVMMIHVSIAIKVHILMRMVHLFEMHMFMSAHLFIFVTVTDVVLMIQLRMVSMIFHLFMKFMLRWFLAFFIDTKAFP